MAEDPDNTQQETEGSTNQTTTGDNTSTEPDVQGYVAPIDPVGGGGSGSGGGAVEEPDSTTRSPIDPVGGGGSGSGGGTPIDPVGGGGSGSGGG